MNDSERAAVGGAAGPERGPLLSPEPDTYARRDAADDMFDDRNDVAAHGNSLLSYLVNSGALDALVVEDEQGQPRLAEGALPVQVDVMKLLDVDPQLGAKVLQDPMGATWDLMDEAYAEGLSASPCPRLWMRPTQVPLPCLPVPAVLASLCRLCPVPSGAAAAAADTAADGDASSGCPAALVCCYGLVAAASSLARRPHSRLLVCSHCGATLEALDERGVAGGPGPGGACCEAAALTRDYQEDLSGRVMVDVQELWLAGLPSALPGGGYHARLGSVRLVCLDELAGAAKVGDVIRVVGLARLLGPAGGRTASAASTGAGPSVAVPLSAASFATAVAELEALSLTHVTPHGLQQLSVLLGCQPHDPLGPRLLRAAASLLSPLSAHLGGTALSGGLTDDPLAPRLVAGSRLDGEGQAGGVAHGSLLLAAGNRGIAVVDAEQLSTKQKSSLCDTLGRATLVLAPGRPEFALPVTPTVWAAACRAEEDGAAAGASGARRGPRAGPTANGGRGGWSGLDDTRFDLLLSHAVTDDLVAGLALDAGSLDDGRPGDGLQDSYLIASLRQHVAAAALLSPPPQLSDAALELLMRYYVAVRQSGVQVTQTEVLRCLVKLATASARLHLRQQVLEAPDCVLAVLLMERTMSCRFGETYMGLSLPPLPEGPSFGGPDADAADAMDDNTSGFFCGRGGGGGGGGGDSVDATLKSMLATLARCLRGFAPSLAWQGQSGL
ncbi:hypothetical protein GPECTOR_96g731 [Gonium pectorale]|uniref:DNA helicase n=1 Tax=Gonium pectorale TaxID=33097 RepID=A0A150G1B1_GONPE|nr:hypothetical protein GPECTOR_96g731 [Gonium pectorale]|eukprot:KXZ43265.1 hypothetical protein GPECTOR_96g731 [Gonium pectorale]